MTIDSLSYFETLDVERELTDATTALKNFLRAVSTLHRMLDDTEHAGSLDDLATALEDSETLLDDVWSQIAGRQAQLEEEEIEQEREERALAMRACS
jgi:Zn-dependent oligopeptidase